MGSGRGVAAELPTSLHVVVTSRIDPPMALGRDAPAAT